MNIVFTGNIGCGKSTVVSALSNLLPEYEFHDVDVLVHELYQDHNFQSWLLKEFGTSDRTRVSNIAFSDHLKCKMLEAKSIELLHDAVMAIWEKPNTVLEFPLYFEMGYDRYKTPDTVVVAVTCSDDFQYSRVKTRDGFSDEKIQAIMAKQLTQERKAELADYVIENNDLTTLHDALLLFIKDWELK